MHEIRSAEALRRRADLLEKMASGMARTDRDRPGPAPFDEPGNVAHLSRTRDTPGPNGPAALPS